MLSTFNEFWIILIKWKKIRRGFDSYDKEEKNNS